MTKTTDQAVEAVAVTQADLTQHRCWRPLLGRLSHRQHFKGGKLAPTCERCGTPIDEKHRETGPVSWEPPAILTPPADTDLIAELLVGASARRQQPFVKDLFRRAADALEAHASPRESALEAAVKGIDDDYMTSESHHPDHVLIPAVKFEAICAALQAHASSRELEQIIRVIVTLASEAHKSEFPSVTCEALIAEGVSRLTARTALDLG